MSNVTDAQMQQALKLLVSTFKARSKQILEKSGRGIDTGRLLDSITADIEQIDGEYDFVVDMESYGEFIDAGVNGTEQNNNSRFSYKDKKPPLAAISPWAKARGLNPYAVQNSIYRKGIKGINFFYDVMDYEVSKIADYIAEAEADNLLNDFGED